MFEWVPRPLDPPHVCAFTRSDQPDVGPFVKTPLAYLTPIQDANGEMRIVPTVNTLFLSAQAIREMCEVAGSPLLAITRERDASREAHIADLEAQVESLHDQLAEARAEGDVLKRHLTPVPDPTDLFDELDKRYARKSGRKPSGTAA